MHRFLSVALLLAAAGCTNEKRSLPVPEGIVDTFDDGNTTSDLGTAWEAVASPGSTASVVPEPGGFRGGALGVTAFRAENATASDVVGVRVPLAQAPRMADPNRSPITADVREMTGLALAIKGRPGSYVVQIGTEAIADADHYNAYVQAGAEWTEYRIPFADFKQEGFGTAVPWTGTALTHVAVYPMLTGDASFAVDQVRFYK